MFNNPYNMFPYQNQIFNQAFNPLNNIGTSKIATGTKTSILKSLSNIKWGSILNNTQKTLNVINQAIPVYYQIKPIWGNLKSFGKIVSIFNDKDINTNEINNNQTNIEKEKVENQNLPTFFIN